MSESLLLDTHILLWVMSSPKKLTRLASQAIEDADHLYISTITAWEIVMLARKGRIDVGPDPADWVRDAVAILGVIPLPPSLDIAMESDLLVDYPRQDPADRFIIATARSFDLPLVTADAVIREWQGLVTVW